jgi:hypothetical protein
LGEAAGDGGGVLAEGGGEADEGAAVAGRRGLAFQLGGYQRAGLLAAWARGCGAGPDDRGRADRYVRGYRVRARDGYASLNGVFSAPLTAAMAIAPTAGAALAASVGGYPALFIVLAGTGAVSAALAMAAKPQPPQSPAVPGIPPAHMSAAG